MIKPVDTEDARSERPQEPGRDYERYPYSGTAEHEEWGWDPGPRTLIICEELNATIAQLAAWWADVRDPSSPKRSPAIGAFNGGSIVNGKPWPWP